MFREGIDELEVERLLEKIKHLESENKELKCSTPSGNVYSVI